MGTILNRGATMLGEFCLDGCMVFGFALSPFRAPARRFTIWADYGDGAGGCAVPYHTQFRAVFWCFPTGYGRALL